MKMEAIPIKTVTRIAYTIQMIDVCKDAISQDTRIV